MAPANYTFHGWMGLNKDSANGNMKWQSFEPKTWEETDVDVKVTHCGICATDLHTLSSGWAPADYPCVVGHEIVGKAVKVGSQVSHIKVGDRVGVGAQADSCLGRKGDCEECSSGLEQYCAVCNVITYNSRHMNGDKSYGGYANYHRAPSHFVFKLPDAVPSAEAAPMLCGGVTTYTPLKDNGCGPGKKVGIVGVGGLGHFGVLWAKALGADRIVGISRKAEKKNDVLKLGADAYIATDDDQDWAQKNERSLDLVICTVSSTKMPLNEYLRLLRTKGRFIQVGVPEGPLPPFHTFNFVAKGLFIGGSAIGSPEDIREMFQLAADQKVKPWIEERPMKDANRALIEMEQGKARYRYTLVNEENLKE